MIAFYVTFFLIVALSAGLMIFFKVRADKQGSFLQDPAFEALRDKIAKVVTVVWMSLYLLHLFLPNVFANRTFDDVSPFVGGENIPFAIITWLNDLAFLVIPIAIFQKSDLFRKIAAYICLPVCLLNAAFFFKYIGFYTADGGYGISALHYLSDAGKAFFKNFTFRAIVFGVMFYLEAILLLQIAVFDGKKLLPRFTKKNVMTFLAVVVALLFSVLPIYVPQYLFKGYAMANVTVFSSFKMGSFFHIGWILFVILEGVLITLIFRKKSYEAKYIVLMCLTLSLLLQYNEMFTGIGEITAHRMPFQLCNMAPFFILLTLLTKSEKAYHFTLAINTVGAFIAMVLCDSTPYGVTYIMNIHYMVEHTNVILVPLMCATLGIFKPLKFKDIKDFVILFTGLFLFLLVLGGIFTGLYNTTGDGFWRCNYLYMFDKGETSNIVGFAGAMFDKNVAIGGFFTLSLIQLFIYVAFLAICTGVFSLLVLIFHEKKAKLTPAAASATITGEETLPAPETAEAPSDDKVE